MDSPDNVPSVPELGGAIGQSASFACKQGQHDLCTDDECRCRCHGRVLGDVVEDPVEPCDRPGWYTESYDG